MDTAICLSYLTSSSLPLHWSSLPHSCLVQPPLGTLFLSFCFSVSHKQGILSLSLIQDLYMAALHPVSIPTLPLFILPSLSLCASLSPYMSLSLCASLYLPFCLSVSLSLSRVCNTRCGTRTPTTCLVGPTRVELHCLEDSLRATRCESENP